MIYAIHPSIRVPSIHASAPVELSPVSPPWEGCSTSFASDAKAFHHFWQEIGRNLESFHLRENKKTVQISALISKKGKPEFRCPKSPRHCLIASQECKFIYSISNTSPNKFDGIDFCYNFCSLKRYQLRLENHGLNSGDAALAIALKGVDTGHRRLPPSRAPNRFLPNDIARSGRKVDDPIESAKKRLVKRNPFWWIS